MRLTIIFLGLFAAFSTSAKDCDLIKGLYEFQGTWEDIKASDDSTLRLLRSREPKIDGDGLGYGVMQVIRPLTVSLKMNVDGDLHVKLRSAERYLNGAKNIELTLKFQCRDFNWVREFVSFGGGDNSPSETKKSIKITTDGDGNLHSIVRTEVMSAHPVWDSGGAFFRKIESLQD